MTSPTSHMQSWRVFLHLAASLGWDAQQVDVKTVFLYSLLPEEEVWYMEQPARFKETGKEDWVWKLVCGLYSMKQSRHIRNKTTNDNMLMWEFTRLTCMSCIYCQGTTTGTIIVAVHVSVFLMITSSKAENKKLKTQMQEAWTILDLGTVHFVYVKDRILRLFRFRI